MAVLALNGIENATLIHIPKLLTDDAWRRLKIVPLLTGAVRDFWETEYENWIKERDRNSTIQALMNKLRLFTTNSHVRDMLCAKERLSPREIMGAKILLADLQGYELGQLETTVLSSLLLARLASLANRPYIIFLDNVEYISAGILESALANPHLCVIMAHAHGRQIDFQAIMARANNIFVFQVNEEDASKFKGVFPYAMQRYFSDQRPYTCYAKVGQNMLQLETYPPYAGTLSKTADRIRTQSAQRYARSRSAVRAYLASVV